MINNISNIKIKCPITNSKNNTALFEIKKFPIYMGVSRNKTYEFSKMRFLINKTYGTVQINPKVNNKRIYFKPHGSGKIGNVWKNHHNIFFKILKKYINGTILEIGGGDQSIVKKIKSLRNINQIYVCGKNISLKKKSNKVQILNKFFDYSILKKIKKKSVNLICHSHTFEHIYDINKFLKLINLLLVDGGKHIFSMPNMANMILNKQANAMNFEHPFYYDENLVENILKNNGFKIIKKIKYLKSHSIIYETQKSKKSEKFTYKEYKKNKIIFNNMYKSWLDDVKKIKTFLKKDTKLYIFGAHIFSQMLIFNGLAEDKVECILDNDKDKINKYLYGTNLLVQSPNILKNQKNAIVVLRVGEYKKEIITQLKKINKNIKYV